MTASSKLDSLLDAGIAHLQSGDNSQAEKNLRAALALDPTHPEALNLLGVSLHQSGKDAEARTILTQAIASDNTLSDAHYNLAEVFRSLGETDQARSSYTQCIRLDPDNLLAKRRLAEVCALLQDYKAAAFMAGELLARLPSDGPLALWTGQLFLRAEMVEGAIQSLTTAISLLPDNVEAHGLLWRALASRGKHEKALEVINSALAIDPDNQDAMLDRTRLLYTMHRNEEATDAAENYVRRFPDDAPGHFLLGSVLLRAQELGAAAIAFAQFIKLDPENADGYAKLGHILLSMGHLSDAEVQLNEAIKLNPKLVGARVHLSVVIERFPKREEEAVDAARAAVEAGPNDPEALNWLGMLLVRKGRLTEAAETFNKTLEIQPNHPAALTGLGILLAGQGQIKLAWEKFETAMDAAPSDPMSIMSALFFANAHPDLKNEDIFVLHQRWASLHQKKSPRPFTHWENDRRTDRRLRIGYISPDLRAHSVSYFFEPLLTAHDRSRVHVSVFDNTLAADPVTLQLSKLADEWFRIVGAGDERVIEIIRDQNIDILVDLAGHTAESRITVFARKPAPIQVNYLGYPNTTGLSEMDYRLTDDLADPPGADTYYTEQLIRLPLGFLCFQYNRTDAPAGPLPVNDAGFITFASFNAVHKINDKVIALWADVLKSVPGSQILLKAAGFADPQTCDLVAADFAKNGVERDRIIFAGRTPSYDDHMALYNRCDIALDTFPYNGTTTTCEALWMGLPVISLAGDRHSGRVGLSILSRLSLPELIAHSPKEFLAIAVKIAADRGYLSNLRSTLRQRMIGSTLMDAPAHAREIEDVYERIWQEWCLKHPA